MRANRYALCISGAVSTHGFVWRFVGAMYKLSWIIHSTTELRNCVKVEVDVLGSRP